MSSIDWNKIARKGTGLLSGIGDIAQMGIGLSRTEDISPYQSQIQDYSQIERTGASSFGQLADLYTQVGAGVVTPSADELRGMDTGQKLGSVASSAVSGAFTGLQVGGGPLGALAGGIVGLGSGIAGWLVGDNKAERQSRQLAAQAEKAKKDNLLNLSAAGDRLSEFQFRSDYAHVAKAGGKIEKLSLEDFAKHALSKPRQASYGKPSIAYKRSFCSGGLKVSMKVK